MNLYIIGVIQRLHVIIPIRLVFGDVMTEAGYNCFVVSLGLSIRLGVICRGRKLLDAEYKAHSSEKRADKLRAVVG